MRTIAPLAVFAFPSCAYAVLAQGARFQIRGQACSKSAGLVIDASDLAGLHSVVAS